MDNNEDKQLNNNEDIQNVPLNNDKENISTNNKVNEKKEEQDAAKKVGQLVGRGSLDYVTGGEMLQLLVKVLKDLKIKLEIDLVK